MQSVRLAGSEAVRMAGVKNKTWRHWRDTGQSRTGLRPALSVPKGATVEEWNDLWRHAHNLWQPRDDAWTLLLALARE